MTERPVLFSGEWKRRCEQEKKRRESAEELYELKSEYELAGEADEDMELKIKQAYDRWQQSIKDMEGGNE